MSGILSIDEQIAAMAAAWPAFTVVERTADSAAWKGPLRPLLRTFVVEIRYRAPAVIEVLDARRLQPRVRILSPHLRPRPGDAEGRLPHVYYVGDGLDDVILCMFDPDADEWSPMMHLAETTVPWTIDWLASYEGWRTTGTWTGGGRHAPVPAIPAR